MVSQGTNSKIGKFTKGNVKQKLEHISSCGYELLGYLILNEDTWWSEYFAPLEQLISETQAKNSDDPKVLGEHYIAQREIDMFKENPKHNRSVCFVTNKEVKGNKTRHKYVYLLPLASAVCIDKLSPED